MKLKTSGSKGWGLARSCRNVSAQALSGLMGSRGSESVGILTYHRIMERGSISQPWPPWSITSAAFAEQLEYLLKKGFHPFPLDQILDHALNGKILPRRAFVVTFDDGFESVYQNAFPILKSLDVPATVFLCTSSIDSQQAMPGDDWEWAGRSGVPPITWMPLGTDQIREMQESGLVTLGAHTHTHQDFRGRPREFKTDMVMCIDVLRQSFGQSNIDFAFPFGRASTDMRAVLRQLGIRSAMTTGSVLADLCSDSLCWGRFNVTEADSPRLLAAKLDGWYLTRGSSGSSL